MQIVITPSTENSSGSISIQLPEFVRTLKMNMGTARVTGPFGFPTDAFGLCGPVKIMKVGNPVKRKNCPRDSL